MDVDTILAGLAPKRTIGPLQRWEEANPKRAADFWRLIAGARAKGVGVELAVAAWNANCDTEADRCPVKQNQVRVALDKREQTV